MNYNIEKLPEGFENWEMYQRIYMLYPPNGEEHADYLHMQGVYVAQDLLEFSPANLTNKLVDK